jgi:hypothetical protein
MISFTEQLVFNKEAIPKGIPKDFRYYRCEISTTDYHYPIEQGYLWLPPTVDITAVEDIINAKIRL